VSYPKSYATLLGMEASRTQRLIQLLSLGLFIGLIFWGLYTFLVYIGTPLHGAVLLKDSVQNGITEACDKDAFLCRGLRSVLPFIGFTITRMHPFLWYGVICASIYALFCAWKWFQGGEMRYRITMCPWMIFAFFLFSVWLLLSTTYFTSNGNHPFKWLFEPVEQVYVNASEDGLAALKENFNALDERGCLTRLGSTNHGAGVFQYSFFCMQSAFITVVMPYVLFILLFLFEILVLGRALFVRFRLKERRKLIETMMSAGLGVCGWTAILWTCGVLSQVTPISIFTFASGWILFGVVPLLFYKHSLYWLRQFFGASWEREYMFASVTMLLGWLLITYLAINFLNVVRPFPIGWDDLGSYLNRPRLMVSYGHFIHSMAPFQWEYLSSLGYLLFGYNSMFGATVAMLINWTAGLLALLSIFAFANFFLGKGRGLLSALLYYSLPLVGHFSFADMKIDNAVFFLGTLSMLCAFIYLFTCDDDDEEFSCKHLAWIALVGIFGGFAFAFKVTAIMVLMAIGAVLLAVRLHWTSFIGSSFLTFAFFAYKGKLVVGRILERMFGEGVLISREMFALIFALIGVSFILFGVYRHRERVYPLVMSVLVLGVSFVASIAPWIIHNNIQYQNFGIPRLTLGAPNTLSPTVAIKYPETTPSYGQDVLTLPPELAIDPEHPACRETGHKEELDRYWGFKKGIGHYLTLPWRIVMNLDSGGYYVTTMPALLLFPLLLLLPFLWTRKGRWMKWLFWGTGLILLQWMFLANGIPWYGIGVFLGLCVGLEALAFRAPDIPSRILVSTFIVLSLFVTFSNRLWQYEQQRNLLEYPLGKVSALAMRERTIPHYDNIRDYVVTRHSSITNRPYLYRVGTFIPYFIPKNLEMIGMTDHQLDQFNCLYQERDASLTLERFKALGFNSIIFDTNTATIEKNLEGTLHQKVTSFVDFLNHPDLALPVVVNDPGRGVAYILIP
jgi:hypothetical protein